MNHNHHLTDLIVALDFPRPDRALEFAGQFQGLPVMFQVGVELFMSGGPDLVRELVHRKNRVFLDLKFHDFPISIARAARQAALLHVEMFTLHLSGGSAMVRSVAEELADIPLLRPKILGVSVLTSFDDVRWAEVTRALTGHATSTSDSVDGIIESSVSWGIDGIVCSAVELTHIRSHFPGLYTVVPDIYPEGSQFNDVKGATPALARELGAHAIVIGKPILESPNPREEVEAILKQLSPAAVSA